MATKRYGRMRGRTMRSLMSFGTLLGVSFVGSLCLCGETQAQQIAVYPPDINLETSRDRQSFVVQLAQPDGITRDVTAQAQVSFAKPELVRLDKFHVYPVPDGTTEMTGAFGGQAGKAPGKVAKPKARRPSSHHPD